jgi:sulfonate transport system permease protein
VIARLRQSHAWRTAAVLVAVLVAWEIVGQLKLIGLGAFPSLSAIVASWVANSDIYPEHIIATLQTAGAGFVIGNAVALVLAVGYVLVPGLEKLTRPLVVVLFCLPVVVAAPILGIAFQGDWPRIILAALLVFFPTMISATIGLRNAPGDALGVVMSAGGGIVRGLVLVRLRAALPDILSGLQIAAPAALLGALLGEFLGGSKGLGVYLIGSLGRGDAATLWAIGLVATIISAVAYMLIGVVRQLIGANVSTSTIDPSSHSGVTSGTAGGRTQRALAGLGWSLAGIVVVLLAWFAFIGATGLPRTLMNSPIEVWNSLVASPRAAQTRATLFDALIESGVPAVIGAAAGIALAVVLAIALNAFPSVSRAVMPFAFISQTIPLVALAPLIAIIFGRGTLTIVLVTVSVTFFPSLVTMIQGLASAPSGPLEVMRSVNAGPVAVLRMVTLPNATPYILASVRLAVPRALTGVLIAEQFITGTGLGGLLGISRGYLDYRMMWNITAVAAFVSLILYLLAQAGEQAVLRRRSS